MLDGRFGGMQGAHAMIRTVTVSDAVMNDPDMGGSRRKPPKRPSEISISVQACLCLPIVHLLCIVDEWQLKSKVLRDLHLVGPANPPCRGCWDNSHEPARSRRDGEESLFVSKCKSPNGVV